MPGRNFLFIPGPTNVPRRIQNAMYVEQEDMRAMDLPEFTKPLYEDLKKIFKTKNGRIFIFPASEIILASFSCCLAFNTLCGKLFLTNSFEIFSDFSILVVPTKTG